MWPSIILLCLILLSAVIYYLKNIKTTIFNIIEIYKIHGPPIDNSFIGNLGPLSTLPPGK